MIKITGIYKLPSCGLAFIIVGSLDKFLETSKELKENKKRREYFEHILLSKDCKIPKVSQQWKLKVISQTDFLSVLEQHNSRRQVITNQSYHPEQLELLCINILQKDEIISEENFHTPKVLSSVTEEDVIEVFI